MGAPAARASELAIHWSKAGHDVTILTGFPNHPTGVVSPEYRKKLRRLIATENLEEVKVVRTWLLPFPNGKPFERMLNYSSFCISAAMTGMALDRPDVVIATSPQLLVGLAGWWLSWWKGTRFIFEVRDLWPESLVAVGMGNPNSTLHRSLKSIAGFLYRKADHVVVVTPAFRKFLIENWNLSSDKISVVENGVETDLFSPKDGKALRHDIGAERRFVVSYIGTIGMAHGLDTLINAAAQLQQVAPEVLFVLVGEGSDRQRLQEIANSRGLNNLLFVGQQPRNRVPEFIAASDASLVLLKNTELFKTVIPTKMLEFMACGKPLILGVDGQARHIMESARAGIFIEPENSRQLAEAVLRLANSPALRDELGRNGRRHILEHFSRRKTATTYIDVLQEIILSGQSSQSAAA